MTIVVDARMLAYPLTGIGRYGLELLQRLVRDGTAEWILLSPVRVPAAVRELLGGRVRWVERDGSGGGGGGGGGGAEWWVQRAARRELRASGARVYLGLANSLPFFGPRAVRYCLVVYDLTFFAVPHLTHPQDLVKGLLVNLPAIVKADRLLAISPAIEAELHRSLPSTRGRTTALPPGGTRLGSAGAPLPFDQRRGFLTVGAHRRKNTRLLLEAYAALPAPLRARHPLYVVGRRIPEALGRRARALGVAGEVELVADASDAELGRLYDQCLALVYPSAYEGLGLPVTEALLAGLPAIVPATSPLVDLLGGAGLVLEPLSRSTLAAAMERMATNERAWWDYHRAAGAAAQLIGWERVAAAVAAALGLAAGG
jgi:alpha-1,3-rhamnosyl/mannosyltransferase